MTQARRVRPELRAIADRQHGLVTRAQAVRVGYRERELRTLTSVHGPWVPVRRGVYAERELVERATANRDGVAALRDRAAHLVMREPHLMSHDSAARAWGLPVLKPRRELVHVTREGVLGTRTEGGVKHHLTRLGLLGSRVIGGMRVTGLARTGVDLGREHGLTAGVVAIDAVRRRGVPMADLRAELELMRHWPHVTEARAAVDLSDPGAETPGESLTRLLVVESGIGPIESQFPFLLGNSVAWVDLLVGRHIIEFDGRVKFRRAGDGGVATRPIEDVLWDERARQNELCALGFGMSRVVWDELLGRQRAATMARIKREYLITDTRFGSVLPTQVRHFADRMADERRRRMVSN